MKANRAELAAALTRAASATGKTMEAIAHIHLETRDGFLYVSATDLQAGVQLVVPASGTIKPCLVPASAARIVAALESDTVEFKLTKDRVAIVGNSTFRLPIFNVDDWPAITIPGDNEAAPLEGFTDRYLAARLAASPDPARPVMNGVRLGQTVAATDSYRIVSFDEPALPEDGFIAPYRLQPKETVDRITWDNRTVAFHTPDGILWGRIVEGSFPKVEKMLDPAKGSATVTADAQHLAAVCAQASMLSPDRNDGMVFAAGTDTLDVSLQSRRGEYETTVKAKVEGDWPKTGFNPTMLRDLFAPVTGEVTLYATTGLKPVQVTSDDFRSTIMPIRLRDDA